MARDAAPRSPDDARIRAAASALPAGDIGGPTPWVVAVMTCLAMLGLAAALALTPAASALSGQIAGRATVQVVEPDPLMRREAVRAVRDALRDAPFVMRIRTVPEAELNAMAARWLGADAFDGANGGAGLPLPALIDVDLVGRDNADAMPRLRRAVAAAVPRARVIAHADWLGPVAGLLRALGWLALGVAVLLVAAAAAVAMLAARAALSAQRATIDILHLVGATDVQVARLFQRHTARDTLIGAGLGGALAIAILAVIAWQLRGITAGLATAGGDGGAAWWSFLWLLLVPPLVVVTAVLTARLSVLRALRAMP